MPKTLVKCNKCGNGKFKYTTCKCSKPQPQKEKRFNISCQFCGEKQGRDVNWKQSKITCHNCKALFRRNNVKRIYFGRKPLKFNQKNYEKFIKEMIVV